MQFRTGLFLAACCGVIGLTGCPSSNTWSGDVTSPEVQGDSAVDVVSIDVVRPPCLRDGDCPPHQVCDQKLNACVACLASTQCPLGEVCVDGECVAGLPCGDNGTCIEGVCDLGTGFCVPCLLDAHCPDGFACVDFTCVPGTTPCADGACPPPLRCDAASNTCVGCGTSTDCAGPEFCDVDHACRPDLCNAGEAECLGDALMRCAGDGGGWTVEDCPEGTSCRDGACAGACVPACAGRQCGDDGCGGSCGACGAGLACSDQGACLGGFLYPCVDGAECASGFCVAYLEGSVCTVPCVGTCPADDWHCALQTDTLPDEVYLCLWSPGCSPECKDRQCGDDRCGGVCGVCPAGTQCNEAGFCQGGCEPKCEGRQCGDDGCGGSCGTCPPDAACVDGRCQGVCVPECLTPWGEPVVCGPNGCGGVCGTCPSDEACDQGRCVPQCVPACGGSQCGPNGCGGVCGLCPDGTTCNEAGFCQAACVGSCAGKQCGDNGCGGFCGACPSGTFCDAGACV